MKRRISIIRCVWRAERGLLADAAIKLSATAKEMAQKSKVGSLIENGSLCTQINNIPAAWNKNKAFSGQQARMVAPTRQKSAQKLKCARNIITVCIQWPLAGIFNDNHRAMYDKKLVGDIMAYKPHLRKTKMWHRSRLSASHHLLVFGHYAKIMAGTWHRQYSAQKQI